MPKIEEIEFAKYHYAEISRTTSFSSDESEGLNNARQPTVNGIQSSNSTNERNKVKEDFEALDKDPIQHQNMATFLLPADPETVKDETPKLITGKFTISPEVSIGNGNSLDLIPVKLPSPTLRVNSSYRSQHPRKYNLEEAVDAPRSELGILATAPDNQAQLVTPATEIEKSRFEKRTGTP